jgi:hypothetical protein
MLFYEQFYQKFGVRSASQLLAPRMPALKNLELPQRSIFHYVGQGPLDAGPPSDEFLFRHVTKPIPMLHVTKLQEFKGAPRFITTTVIADIRKYHNKNRRYRLNRNLPAMVRDPMAPAVINYAWLARLYRYQRNLYAEYNRWWNINATVWKTIATVSAETDRHQFIEVGLPTLLPGLTDLRIAAEMLVDEAGLQVVTEQLSVAMEGLIDNPGFYTESLALEAMNSRTLRIFHSPESLVLLELWKWCGPNRAKSAISAVPTDKLNKVNLIFVESGRWFVVNLGQLDSWRKATEEELAANAEANQDGIDPVQFQKRVLRMVMALFQVRTDASPQVLDESGEGEEQEAQAETTTAQAANNAVPEAPAAATVVTGQVTDPASGVKAVVMPAKQPEVVQPDLSTETPAAAIKEDPHLDEQIEKDLAELDRITHAQLSAQDAEQDAAVLAPVERTLESGVMAVANRLADDGMLSAAEYRRYDDLSKKFHQIVAPDGKRTLKDYIDVHHDDVAIHASPAIADIPTVLDKTMLKSSLHEFDKRYIEEVLPRHVSAMVMNLQHAGICVTDYKVERMESVQGAYDAHTVKVTPVEGAASTLRFMLPAAEEDGSYTANGVKYHFRKQKGDLPIRKISPSEVALTSYYGKLFVQRSEKKVNDYGTWLRNQVMAKGLDEADQTITDLHPMNVFNPEFKVPRLYSTLAMGFNSFQAAGFTWMFDYTLRETVFGKDAIEQYERDGGRLIAHNDRGEFILVDQQDALYKVVEGKLEEMPAFEELVQVPVEKAPIDFVEIRILARSIPIGFVLGYEMGLTQLCRFLKVQPRIVPAGTRLGLQPHEYPLIFEDETWVFSKDNRYATMILAGFNEYHRALRDYSSHEFDKRGVYLNLLEGEGSSARYIREIDHLYQLFIDPITLMLLQRFHEPEDFRGLLLKATSLLMDDMHPDELDPKYMRVKGYERWAGAVYSELVKAVKSHSGRPGKSRHPIELNPYAVWTAIQTDPSKGLVKDINPIQNLKEKEAMTFSGTGGRSSRSMTKHTRAYHQNDMGVTSESTVDSGDVGINTYTSADPQFDSLLGTSKPYVIGKTGATALLSTSALISPASDRDDPKRVNFVGIQHGHGIACKGYRTAALRTGYEQVLAHRTSDLYATTAKQDGRVVSRNDHGIVVEFADGKTKGIQLGRRYGAAEGLTIPHDVISELKEGDEFKAGEVIAYNPGFFKRDMLNPKNVIWKVGLLARTVLMESTQTLEDSSSISHRISEQLTTAITKQRTIVVNFEQSIHKLVKAGQAVGSEDILCIIEDALTRDNALFDQESLDTLKVLSAHAPQAKFKGVVERIEVYYHGDMEDMSQSLQAIVEASDRDLVRRAKSAGKKAFTGQVDEGYRVEGNPLALDTAAIQIYLTAEVPAGVGDKGVFANQMKTVFGRVLENDWKTESGLVIDAVFGAKSIADRIVTSPYVIGTTTTLLDVIGKKAVAIYRGKKA